MKNSKNVSSTFSFFSKIKERIDIYFKNWFPKNRIYVEASTSTPTHQLDQNLNHSSKNLSSQLNLEEGVKQKSNANISSNKFVEVTKFNRAIKSYSELNSSNYLSLNLNSGLSFQPIYAEGNSPAELELESFNATLECYKSILSSKSALIFKGFQFCFKTDFLPDSNSNSMFHPINSEVNSSATIDRPSTSLNKPQLPTGPTKRTLAL